MLSQRYYFRVGLRTDLISLHNKLKTLGTALSFSQVKTNLALFQSIISKYAQIHED